MEPAINLHTEIKSNPTSPFLPINTSKNDFNWNQVIALFLADLLGRSAEGLDTEQLKEHCEQHFRHLLDDPEYWDLLEAMYFRGDALGNIAPELLLVAMQSQRSSASDRRVAELFISLRTQEAHSGNLSTPLNFIEQQILAVALKHLTHCEPKAAFPPYLPFLAELFQRDLRFLASKPQVMLSLIQSFLELYGFLYISQLALNLSEWKDGEPRSKSLYFILENEKASTERSQIALRGYSALKEPIWRLFPVLAMLETLFPSNVHPVRLWELPALIGAEGATSAVTRRLAGFAKDFAQDRKLPPPSTPRNSALDWIDELLDLSVLQFGPGSSRQSANQRVDSDVHERLGGSFIQARGRAGRVLVLSQDVVLLLTNLAVGEHSRLRIQELLGEFAARGVHFDKQSEQALIEFFERIGNVERMSDSGDAVYVRKTI